MRFAAFTTSCKRGCKRCNYLVDTLTVSQRSFKLKKRAHGTGHAHFLNICLTKTRPLKYPRSLNKKVVLPKSSTARDLDEVRSSMPYLVRGNHNVTNNISDLGY